jgi:hypothetical protein
MTPYAKYKAWWMRWQAEAYLHPTSSEQKGWGDRDKAWEEHINGLTLFELMETLELYERETE